MSLFECWLDPRAISFCVFVVSVAPLPVWTSFGVWLEMVGLCKVVSGVVVMKDDVNYNDDYLF